MNGHVWHYCAVHPLEVSEGEVDHALPTNKCTCKVPQEIAMAGKAPAGAQEHGHGPGRNLYFCYDCGEAMTLADMAKDDGYYTCPYCGVTDFTENRKAEGIGVSITYEKD